MQHTSTPPTTTPAIEQAIGYFLTPHRCAAKIWSANLPALTLQAKASTDWPDGESIPFVCHRLGSGPAVLLVHGWESQAADLWHLADAIAQAGFSVWCPDLPAHGNSPGSMLSIPLATQVLHSVAHKVDHFHAVIGHSLGGAVAVNALATGLAATQAIVIAAPTHYGAYARQVAHACSLSDSDTTRMLDRLQEITGTHPDDIDIHKQAATLNQRCLWLHANDDEVVPVEEGIRAVTVWKHAELHRFDNLGHFRILQDATACHQLLQALARHA